MQRGELASMRHRSEYQPPDFYIDHVDIRFDLALPVTRVTTTLAFRRAETANGEALILDGRGLTLKSVCLDGEPLSSAAFKVNGEQLILPEPPNTGELTIVTEVTPEDTGMEGLVFVDGAFATHCEPEGFRRITYFPDRPDVLARYKCLLIADAESFPVLLSNGRKKDEGTLPDGRHYAVWEDPYPKASYLFAVYAGKADCISARFKTRSGREISLAVYARGEDLPFCSHGLNTLKKAMAWDEAVYNREYDLDILNVAVMRSYPGGAMEKKGLNLYATEFFLTAPEIATDDEMRRVEAVVGHEYFHNWSGNRVGCKDWFELSLKEGFTIFRQQEFMSFLTGDAVARIDDVKRLRELQFPEDDSDFAHAVRPESYRAVNNLYTRTVYEKGAELVRMLRTILGKTEFYRGADLFFDDNDGRAATIDDFIEAMATVSGRSHDHFRQWYSSIGARHIYVQGTYDGDAQQYELILRQIPSPRDPETGPLPAPLRVGLLASDGHTLKMRLAEENGDGVEERMFVLRSLEEKFVFKKVEERPTPSLFRGYSAPIRLDASFNDSDLSILALHDSDSFNRWDAAQRLVVKALRADIEGVEATTSRAVWLDLFAELMKRNDDPALLGRMLSLPTQRELAAAADEVHIEGIWRGRRSLAAEAVRRNRALLRAKRAALIKEAREGEGSAARKLANICLFYLMNDPESDDIETCKEQWRSADILENSSTACRLLITYDEKLRQTMIHAAYERWRESAVLTDHWFATLASAEVANASLVSNLTKHKDYSLHNATRLKAIFDNFILNQAAFHDPDGAGYDFVEEVIVGLIQTNPRLSARFLKGFSGRSRLDKKRNEAMGAALDRVAACDHLSDDLQDLLGRLR